MKSQSGFGLIQLLFATAILGVITVGMLSSFNYLAMSSSANAQNAAALYVMEGVTGSFGDNDVYCEKILGGTAIDPANASGVQLQRLDRYNLDGVKVGAALVRGQAIPQTKLVVSDLRLKPTYALDSQNLVANMEITVQKSGVLGSTTSVYDFPVYAVIKAGKILTCSTAPQGRVAISNRMCDVWYDGYGFYDPVSKLCQDTPDVLWINSPMGSVDKVACPAGYKLAASRYDPNACEAACAVEAPGLGSQTRVYTNMTKPTQNLDLRQCQIDWVKNSCNWTWNLAEDRSKTSISARCVPVAAN